MDLVDVNTPDLMVRFILKFSSLGFRDDRSRVLGIRLKHLRGARESCLFSVRSGKEKEAEKDL